MRLYKNLWVFAILFALSSCAMINAQPSTLTTNVSPTVQISEQSTPMAQTPTHTLIAITPSSTTSLPEQTVSPTPIPILTITPTASSSSTVTLSKTHYVEDRSNFPYISDMEFDSDGALWLVGLDGVTKWNPNANITSRYTISDGLTSDYINRITIDDKDTIWVSAYGGVYGGDVLRFDGTRWISHQEQLRLAGFSRPILVGLSDNRVWVTTREPDCIYYYDGNNWICYDEIVGLWGVSSLVESSDGTVWAVLNCCMGPTTLLPLDTSLPEVSEQGKPSKWWDMTTGPNGDLWAIAHWWSENGVTIDNIGVAQYDPDKNVWTSYIIPSELLSDDERSGSYSLAVASPDSFWVGTAEGRLLHFKTGEWYVKSSDNGFDFPLGPMLIASDGTLWIGTLEGLVVQYHEDNWQIYDLTSF